MVLIGKEIIAVYFKANSRHVGLMKRMKYVTKDVLQLEVHTFSTLSFLIRIIILPCIFYWPNSDKGMLPRELINSRIQYYMVIDFIADEINEARIAVRIETPLKQL